MEIFERIRAVFQKTKRPESDGIEISLLQRSPERYSRERLQAAMQRAWKRKIDPQTFLAVTTQGGALLKVDSAYITMLHTQDRLEADEYIAGSMPGWAGHNGTARIGYKAVGGIAPGAERENLYGFLGLFCAEVLDKNIAGIYFLDERVFVPNHPLVVERLRTGTPYHPAALTSLTQGGLVRQTASAASTRSGRR